MVREKGGYMFEGKVDRARRLISVRASGNPTLAELKEALATSQRATDSFRGEPHIVLADMRGLVALTKDKQAVLAEIIRYGRERGCVWCVHLSDSSIARLQQARLAREASPYDGATVDVVSVEEAERVIQEKLAQLAAMKRPA
jgi:hypothetical protein